MVREGSSELKLNDEKEPVMGNLGESCPGLENSKCKPGTKSACSRNRKKPSVAGAEWAGGGKSGRK